MSKFIARSFATSKELNDFIETLDSEVTDIIHLSHKPNFISSINGEGIYSIVAVLNEDPFNIPRESEL